jgi:hypothetical protein
MTSNWPTGPLVQAVEDLAAKGYIVLTPEQGEEAATLLGVLAFDFPDHENVPERARALLESWPKVNLPWNKSDELSGF